MFAISARKVALYSGVASALAIAITTAPLRAQEARGPARDTVQQGIHVHGHWVVEVRNPDGSLVTRREFDNALTSYGVNLVLGVLTVPGTTTTPVSSLVLSHVASGNPTINPRPGQWSEERCGIAPVTARTPQSDPVTGFRVSETSSGTAVATASRTCEGVYTSQTASGGYPVTWATLNPPITVVAGQSILLSVTFTAQ